MISRKTRLIVGWTFVGLGIPTLLAGSLAVRLWILGDPMLVAIGAALVLSGVDLLFKGRVLSWIPILIGASLIAVGFATAWLEPGKSPDSWKPALVGLAAMITGLVPMLLLRKPRPRVASASDGPRTPPSVH